MHPQPYALQTKFWTPGVMVMLAVMFIGAVAMLARFSGGLGYVSNLNNAYPWGIWIGIDVASGVALAAGGFTTAALAYILGRDYYEAISRPALLTALLGYTFVAFGIFIDIGRPWAIWKPIIFRNSNSILFEVAMCVMIYLTVLIIEFVPVVAEQYGARIKILGVLGNIINKIIWIFIILGVVLSCMHQSGLGSMVLIFPTKLHPLWYTPILPLLFLISAIAVGFPMVVFETTLVTSSLNRESEMKILSRLSRITVWVLGIYLVLKLGDMWVRNTFIYLLDGTYRTNSFLVEVIFGVLVPWFLLLSKGIRNSRRGLFVASTLIVGGVLLNRINVFLVGFKPPHSQSAYFPAIGEIAVTLGIIATLMFIYRVLVTYLPVLSAKEKEVLS